MITNPRKAKAFKKLNKEASQETLKKFLLEIFKKYATTFRYIFEVSDYYQNPMVWTKGNEDRINPNDFINGERSVDRIIRLISKDKKCVAAIQKLDSYDFENVMKEKVKILLS